MKSINNKLLNFEYATFRKEVREIIIRELHKKPKVFLDPLAGTAPLLPDFETLGHKAYLFDILPVHYHINKLKLFKTKELFYEYGQDWYKQKLLEYMKPLNRKRRRISSDWIDESILKDLKNAWDLANKEKEEIATVLKGIILMSIRSFSSYTKSKNSTWIRPGGITSNESVGQVIEDKIRLLKSYYESYPSLVKQGKCIIGIEDAMQLHLEEKVDFIITSPPYCNRLDYLRAYSPEHFFLSKVGYPTPNDGLIGTNVVKNYTKFEEDLLWIKKASNYAFRLIKKIEQNRTRKGNYYEDRDYYVRYYTRYYTRLLKTFENLLQSLLKNGKMYIVVQDNQHRGKLIQIDKALNQLFKNNGYKCHILKKWERKHLGRMNVSREHIVVYVRHYEKLLLVER